MLYLEGGKEDCVWQKDSILLLLLFLFRNVNCSSRVYFSICILSSLFLYFNFFKAVCMVIRVLNILNTYLMVKKKKCLSSNKKMLLSLVPSKSHPLSYFPKFMAQMKLSQKVKDPPYIRSSQGV